MSHSNDEPMTLTLVPMFLWSFLISPASLPPLRNCGTGIVSPSDFSHCSSGYGVLQCLGEYVFLITIMNMQGGGGLASPCMFSGFPPMSLSWYHVVVRDAAKYCHNN